MAEGPRHAGEPRVPQIASARRGSVVTGEPFARLLIYLLALERGDTSTLRGAPAPVPAWHPVTREAAEPLSLSLSLSPPPCAEQQERVFLSREIYCLRSVSLLPQHQFLTLVCLRAATSLTRCNIFVTSAFFHPAHKYANNFGKINDPWLLLATSTLRRP